MLTLDALADIALRHAPHEGVNETAVPGLAVVRYSQPTPNDFAVHPPSVCIVAQGAKQMTVGRRSFDYDASSYVVVSVDVPVSARILVATPEQPYLCLRVALDCDAITSLLTGRELACPDTEHAADGVYLDQTAPEIVDAVLRLARQLDRGRDDVLRGVALRELFYWLLRGAHGQSVRQLVISGSAMHRVNRAISWLKAHFTEPLRIAELARHAGMGTSALHAHFKRVTGMTPLQYQKQLRLQCARQLMLARDLGAATAAFQVGYESPTQFSREYRRLFGQPPARDVGSLRQAAAGAR